jgi:hypothetical protein
MNLYLDDDTAAALLIRHLRSAGHDVRSPADLGLTGADDPVHLMHAIRQGRVLMTRNYDDFLKLHNLVIEAQGHHFGVLVLRRDSDSRGRMAAHDIARALRNLVAAGVPIADEYIVLNAWQ